MQQGALECAGSSACGRGPLARWSSFEAVVRAKKGRVHRKPQRSRVEARHFARFGDRETNRAPGGVTRGRRRHAGTSNCPLGLGS